MKKKLAGILAAMMIFTLGTTSVFAANSPTSEQTAEQKAQQLRDSVSEVNSSQDGINVRVERVGVNEVADANTKAASYSQDAEVLGMVELKSDNDFSTGVTLTFYVSGVRSGDNIRILHKLADGTWEVIVPYVGDGFVRATFYSLSPIAIVKYPAGVSVSSTQNIPQNSDDSQNNNSENSSNSNTNDESNSNTNSNTSDSTSDSDSSSSSNSDSSSSSESNAEANVNVNINNNSNSNNGSGNATNNSTTNNSGSRPSAGGSGAATSPKTGQGAPVLPVMVIVILLGAMTVYGKKAQRL